MGEGNIRNYQVEYAINVTGNAASSFATFAKNADELQKPLKDLEILVTSVNRSLTSIRDALRLQPTIDLTAFKESLTNAENAVKASSERMAKQLQKVLGEGATLSTGKVAEDIKKSANKTAADIQKEMNRLREKIQLGTGKDVSEKKKKGGWVLNNSKNLKEEVRADIKQWRDLEKELSSMTKTPPATKLNKTASSVIDSVKKHEDIDKTAKAIRNLNDAVNKFNNRKAIKVAISADAKKAIAVLNDFLALARDSVAVVPLSAKAPEIVKGKGAKGVKGKGVAANENEQVIVINTKLNSSTLTQQLTTAVTNLQTKATELPVKVATAVDTTLATEQLTQSITKLQELAKSKSIDLKITGTSKYKSLSQTASALKRYNEAVENFNNRKEVKLKINADASKAVTVYDDFYKKVQSTIATIPLSAKPVETAKKSGKVVGKGVATPVSETVVNAKKSQEQIAEIKAKFNGGELVSQLNASVAELQKLADKEPIRLRGMFNGGDAGFQLNQSIASLQKLADGKPIVLKSTTSTPNVPNNGTASAAAVAPTTQSTTSGAVTVKDGKGSKQVSTTGWTDPTPANIKAYERHQQQMSDLRISNAVDLIKRKEKFDKIAKANNQAAYEQLWGQENARLNAINSRHNRQELARIRSMVPPTPPVPPTPKYPDSRWYTANVNMPKGDFNSRAKSLWYSFTGNTSFGARTPMAVEMAKGMGTMFAIGGAMSAVGSSLHQAIEYQNVMKTTNAILKNGTNNYSDVAFKGMEQIVRQVGKGTKFTAPEVAHAAKFLAMAGYDIPEINAAIKPVSNIALIGDTNLGETADKLTNVMTTFGINPEKMNDIADIMTTTFTRSNTDMMMLAESAKYAGGIAHLYGGNFQNNFADVMAMFGIMGNAGIQASSAGTTLRMMYQNLMQPNKNQRAALNQYGITTRDSNGNPLEMIEILKQMAEKVPADKMADAVGNMFRITAQPGAAALANAVKNKSLQELMEANRSAAGSGVAEKIANEKKNTVAGLWAQVSSTFTEGILQAFEGKEGGWAGMLARLRDYLAEPETVEMLRSIVNLVETLAHIMGRFAKIYAKVYDMFPGIINGWMKFQLIMTQVGYLVTPLVQLASILNTLKTAINGVTAATATATIAEKTVGRERKVSTATNVAANILSGRVLPTANKRSNGLVAANIAASMAAYQYFKPYNEIKKYASRQDWLGPLSMTRNQNWVMSTTGQENIANQIALWERSRMYQMGGMTKSQKRQLNATINRKLAELRTIPVSGTTIPSVLPLSFGLGNVPIYQHGRHLVNGSYYRAGINNVMPFHQYSNGAASILQGGKKSLGNAAKYRLYAQKWGAISAYRNIPAAKRAMAAQKAEQYIEAAIWASQAEAKEKAETIIANRGRINNIAGKRHAVRGFVGLDVASRYARTAGWKKGAGFALKNGLASGVMSGVFNLSGIVASIKGMTASIFGGLAKALGMLISPVGLITAAITTAVASVLIQVNKIKKIKAERIKGAKENAVKAHKARMEAYKPIEEMNKKYLTIGDRLTPIKDNKIIQETKKQKTRLIQYIDALDTTKDSFEAEKQWSLDIVGNKNSALAFGSGALSFKGGRKLSDRKTFENSINYGGDNIRVQDYVEQIETSQNKNNTNSHAWEALFVAGANDPKVIAAQEQIRELRKNLLAKKITQGEFVKEANKIRSGAANPYAKGLLNAKEYQAPEIVKNNNWGRFDFYQQGGWNVLTAEMNADIGTISGYLQGIDKLKSGVKQYSNQWWQAIARVYDGIKYPFETAKGTVDLVLKALPNGRIDTSKIIEQINKIADNLKLNISDFAGMASSIYEAMAKLGVVPGKYYSDFRKFTYSQLEHAPVTATDAGLYFDRYIAKGDKNAKWGSMNRQEYIDYVQSKSGNKGEAAKERVRIRKSMSHSAADNAKRQFDKTIKGAVDNSSGLNVNNPGQNINNSNAGGNTTNNSPGNNQKDYASRYDRTAARPTQVIINIDNLARFDRTAIAGNADERAIVEAIETKVAEAVMMMSSQMFNSVGNLMA